MQKFLTSLSLSLLFRTQTVRFKISAKCESETCSAICDIIFRLVQRKLQVKFCAICYIYIRIET